MIVSWIESQSTFIIALIVFSLCYAIAVATFRAAATLACRPAGNQLKEISPMALAPLTVILSLLLALLSNEVGGNIGRARNYIGQETSALGKAALFADGLPPEIRTKAVAALQQHVNFVIAHDWPEMAILREPDANSPGLTSAIAELLSFTPVNPNQQLAQQRVIAAIEQAFEARRNRIQLSQTEIASIQWVVILVLALLIFMMTAMTHIGRPVVMATALFMFSTAMAICMVFLMTNDRPFAAGGITMTPEAFRKIVLH